MSANEIPTFIVPLQVDKRALYCVLVTSVTTVLALFVTDWLGRRRRRLADVQRHAVLSAMLDKECEHWADARERVVTHAEALRKRIKTYQTVLDESYTHRLNDPDRYLVRRVESLKDDLVVSRMEKIFKQLNTVETPSEADEYIEEEDDVAAAPQVRNVVVVAANRTFTVDLFNCPPVVMSLCEKIKGIMGIPISRQLLRVTGEGEEEEEEQEKKDPEMLLDVEGALPTMLTEVSLEKLKAFEWDTGGKVTKTKTSGYSIIRTNQSVALGEVNVLTVRLNTGNNELHDLGAGAPRFTEEQGKDRWLVSLYVEGGIASHNVPRLSAPSTIQTLLVNGVTRKLSWFSTPYPTDSPCSTMSLLKKDFPITPLLQTHGTGAEFEILD